MTFDYRAAHKSFPFEFLPFKHIYISLLNVKCGRLSDKKMYCLCIKYFFKVMQCMCACV